MNPLRITARNYGPFDSLDVEIPAGCIAVVGANGAGKSTLVNSLDLALFGAKSLGDFITATGDGSEMELCLEFEHAGELYRVRRTFSARGRGKSTLDFERRTGESLPFNGTGADWVDEWSPLTREDQKQTQALIEETIGLTREGFRASAFLMQRGPGSITNPGLTPKQKKEMLTEIIRLASWERLVEKARSEETTIRDITSRLAIQVEEAERELERRDAVAAERGRLEQDLTQAKSDLEDAEKTHTGAQEALAASRELLTKLQAARQIAEAKERELQTATARRRQVEQGLEGADGLPELRTKAEALAAERPTIELKLVAAREAESARAEHRRLTGERDRLVDQANELANREADLYRKTDVLEHSPSGTCDRCEQELGADAKRRAIASMKAEAKGYHDQAAELMRQSETLLAAIELTAEGSARGPNDADRATLEQLLRTATDAERTLAGIAEREKRVEELSIELAQIGDTLPELEDAVAEQKKTVAALEADLPDGDLEAAVARAYGTLIEARNLHEGLNGRLVVAKAEIERLAKIEERTRENRAELVAHRVQLDLLELAARVFGHNGIPAYVLENTAIPFLEVASRKALAALGGKTAGATIELRTQRAKKDGTGAVETLDIVAITAEGVERPYERWSGGEQMRIDIALRLAFGEYLAARGGAPVEILIMDEPSDLDASGKADLIEILQGARALGIDKVLLVSHDPDLRDAFDESIEVELISETTSRVKGGELAEAIA